MKILLIILLLTLFAETTLAFDRYLTRRQKHKVEAMIASEDYAAGLSWLQEREKGHTCDYHWWKYKGICLTRQGNTTAGCEALQQALTLCRTSIETQEVNVYLADNYARTGKGNDAVALCLAVRATHLPDDSTNRRLDAIMHYQPIASSPLPTDTLSPSATADTFTILSATPLVAAAPTIHRAAAPTSPSPASAVAAPAAPSPVGVAPRKSATPTSTPTVHALETFISGPYTIIFLPTKVQYKNMWKGERYPMPDLIRLTATHRANLLAGRFIWSIQSTYRPSNNPTADAEMASLRARYIKSYLILRHAMNESCFRTTSVPGTRDFVTLRLISVEGKE